jgi:hypothetical protein
MLMIVCLYDFTGKVTTVTSSHFVKQSDTDIVYDDEVTNVTELRLEKKSRALQIRDVSGFGN